MIEQYFFPDILDKQNDYRDNSWLEIGILISLFVGFGLLIAFSDRSGETNPSLTKIIAPLAQSGNIQSPQTGGSNGK